MSLRRGFTLIELLVVIAIIGLLASIILASLNTAQQKGRDAKRLADIQDIQNALELYEATCRNYPNSLTQSGTGFDCPTGVNITTFISPVPTDPRSGQSYLYTAFGPSAAVAFCTSYHLGADLEVGENVGNNVAATSSTKCSGGSYVPPIAPATNNGISTILSTRNDFAPEGTVGAWVYDVTP